MACANCNEGSPNGCVCQPGRRGDPGPANSITMDITMLPAGSEPVVVPSGVTPNQHFNLGIPEAAVPEFTATAVSGTPVNATITGTPEDPILNLTIPPGTDGARGANPFTSLTANFVMPASGVPELLTVGSTESFGNGHWVYVQGAGAPGYAGGWMVVAGSPVSATQVFLRNPGVADGISVANGYPGDVLPFNRAAGGNVLVNGALNQLGLSGRDGPRGADGEDGDTPIITVVTTPPSTPPPTPAEAFVLYLNGASGASATQAIPYTYNYGTVAWEANANIAGPAGSQTFFQAADPNVVPIPSSNIGDSNWAVNPGGMVLTRKATVSSWPTVGSLPFGPSTDNIVHAAPGVATLELSFGDFSIEADKDIELDWDDSSYNGQGDWTVAILNTDAGAIDLTFTAARWEEEPSLAIPGTTAIAAGATLMLRFVKNQHTGLYVITQFFLPTAL